MTLLGEGALLRPGAVVIAEHRAKTPPLAQYGHLKIYRSVKQGESGLAFYAVAGEEGAAS